MADKAHGRIDRKLAAMERHLTEIYTEAQGGIQKKAAAYFEKFAKADEEKRDLVRIGRLTEAEYEAWRKGKMMYGKRFSELKENIAQQLLRVNETATAYINGQLPEVYSLGYNALESSVDGVGGYSFTLVDADTVRTLATADGSLLPSRVLDPAKDIPWNMKKVNAQVLQGILQGESIPDIAGRMQNVTDMNRTAAVRTARTMVTGAENKGRLDSYARAEADGIMLQKEWLATNDARVRHWHAELDGQLRDREDPFENSVGKIMFPGDPSADGANVYNCRCSMAARIISIGKTKIADRLDKADRETVQDVIEKDPKGFDIRQKMLYNEKADKEQLSEYKSRLGKDAPRSLPEFRQIKYYDSDAYDELKSYYRYRGRVPEATKSDFQIAKRIKANGIVGTIRVPAAKMDVSNISAADNHAFRHGCTLKDAKNYIENAKVSIGRQRWDGYSINFYSLDGAAYIDHASGKVKTIFSKVDFDPQTKEMMGEFE